MSTNNSAIDEVIPPTDETVPDEITLLHTIISQQLSITADDGTTLLTPTTSVPNSTVQNAYAALIQVKPFGTPLEAMNPNPQVIVGPTLVGRSLPFSGGLVIKHWIPVQITVLAYDLGSDWGFQLTGNLTRSKIARAIRKIVQNNRNNPGGTGQFNNLHMLDPGKHGDIAPGTEIILDNGTRVKTVKPLYRTIMKVEFFTAE